MDLTTLKEQRIAVGVGGGIAAYKACELVRELVRAGAHVRVAMTQAAEKFVTPLSLQSLSQGPVLTDLFDVRQEALYGHLDLARWADLYLIAPATADLIARIRMGLANDAVTTSLLAFKGRVLLAPAMNVAMWENPITQENLSGLLRDSRFRTVGPNVGPLADGEWGAGRLAEVPEILGALAALAGTGSLTGARVLVTAGPTREYLDPVRFLSNPSSGKMGLALAQVARSRGANVTLVLGPVELAEVGGLEIIRVTSAEEMAKEVLARIDKVDYFVSAAAVGDYRPRAVSAQKLKKSDAESTLVLVPTTDILAEASKRLGRRRQRALRVGFAAETENLEANAKAKLIRKDLDAIVANDVTRAGIGFAADENRVTVLTRRGERQEMAGSKRDVASRLWDLFKAEHEALAASRSAESRRGRR
jgi:phosphopantothenoylcysteine decarboxylase/phosphopantothenate--cysteine ligase